MSRKHRSSRPRRLLWSESFESLPEDWREEKSNANRRADRKSAQLCHQIAATLDQVLGGEARDPILAELRVRDVEPLDGSSQVLVIVTPIDPTVRLDCPEVLSALERATGWLRSEVAAAICRKRTPRLVFQFLPLAPERDGGNS